MAKEDFMKKENIRKNVMSKDELQQVLIDNFIGLQKVMTNLSVKFDELSANISKLLQLFEISAKTFAERYSGQDVLPASTVDSELVKKLNDLLDQNKIISKGIMLMEEKLREKSEYPEQMPQQQMGYPMPQQPMGYPMMMLPSMQQQFQPQPQPPPLVPYKKEIGARQESKQKY